MNRVTKNVAYAAADEAMAFAWAEIPPANDAVADVVWIAGDDPECIAQHERVRASWIEAMERDASRAGEQR